jgi:hypothetical protein
VANRFGVWACFDDEERIATYAERAVPGVRRVAGRRRAACGAHANGARGGAPRRRQSPSSVPHFLRAVLALALARWRSLARRHQTPAGRRF